MTSLTHGSSTALLGNDLPDWIRNEPPPISLLMIRESTPDETTTSDPSSGVRHSAFQKVFHYWSELFCIRLMLLVSLLIESCSDQEQQRNFWSDADRSNCGSELMRLLHPTSKC